MFDLKKTKQKKLKNDLVSLCPLMSNVLKKNVIGLRMWQIEQTMVKYFFFHSTHKLCIGFLMYYIEY